MHALLEFQRSGAYGKRDIGLISKTRSVVQFLESISQWPSFMGAN